MNGIDLDKPVVFGHSSMRYFSENEYYITRFCEDDVLLLVFEGVLRFTEDGTRYEVFPGQYHIHKNNTHQTGEIASDSPKYLYVHFHAEWSDSPDVLPQRGEFDYTKLRQIMEELDQISHKKSLYISRSALFYEILLMLRSEEQAQSISDRIAAYISEHLTEITLDMICKEFSFSKNHIILLFKKQYGITPVNYINRLKLERAEYLLEVTSETLSSISQISGFGDYSHFYKLFLKKNGLPPSDWRKIKQMKPI